MKKRWFIAGTILLIVSGLLLPQLAADVHFFLSEQYGEMTLNPLLGWRTVMTEGKPLKLYFMLVALTALFLLWVIVSSTYLNYRSKMIVVTPEIQTPCAEGQGQFGTAKWLTQDRFAKVFGMWRVNLDAPVLKELMQCGEKDRKEIENANIQTN